MSQHGPIANLDERLEPRLRRQLGAYYTPAAIVAAILDRVLEPKLRACRTSREVLAISVYDPACGDGRFLCVARDRILKRLSELSDSLIPVRRVEGSCLFGVDLDSSAIQEARKRIPDARLDVRDALTEAPARSFDVVVGNPPYGVETGGRGESTRLFIDHALKALRPGGAHAFVVPKALLFSATWHRSAESLNNGLLEIIDCGRAWPDVKLEQIVYVYDVSRASNGYRTSVLSGSEIFETGWVDRGAYAEFGLLLNGVSRAALEAGRAFRVSGELLGRWTRNSRGAALQGELRDHGRVAVYGGREIARYRLSARPRGYLKDGSSVEARAWLGSAASSTVLAQNIVAHVSRPSPRLKISVAAAPRMAKAWAFLDTINKIEWSGPYSRDALVAILNSQAVGWYVHRFVLGLAVRTIHFDAHVTDRIPVPRRLKPALERELARLSNQMARSRDAEAEKRTELEIDHLVFEAFDLGEGVARAVRV